MHQHAAFLSCVRTSHTKLMRGILNMKYDFTSIIDRRGMDSVAVDLRPGSGPEAPKEGFDVIPMWIADMNFPTVPTIQEAIIERAKHPMFGYFLPKEEYFDSIIKWHEVRNGVTGLTKEHIGYENGVLGCATVSYTHLDVYKRQISNR